MNPSNTSAVEKALKAIAYVVISGGLLALIPFLQNNPQYVGGTVFVTLAVAGINGALVFIKGWADPNTPTLPK